MSKEIRTEGRPDWNDPSFGVTYLKKVPKYVYAARHGMLLHEIADVQARWYEYGPNGKYLVRRRSPRLGIHTKCGMYLQVTDPEDERVRERTKKKAVMCELPKPDAVLCGRCRGEGPVFARGCKPKPGGPTRQEAKARLGCVVEIK